MILFAWAIQVILFFRNSIPINWPSILCHLLCNFLNGKQIALIANNSRSSFHDWWRRQKLSNSTISLISSCFDLIKTKIFILELVWQLFNIISIYYSNEAQSSYLAPDSFNWFLLWNDNFDCYVQHLKQNCCKLSPWFILHGVILFYQPTETTDDSLFN